MMKIFMRVCGVLSILAFVIVVLLALRSRLSWEYSALSFGLMLVTIALETSLSRRDMSGGKVPAGSPLWKIVLISTLLTGAFVVFMGGRSVFNLTQGEDWNGAALIAILAALLAVQGVLSIGRAKPSLGNPSDVVKDAETYAAHGRTAQAVSMLEKALRDSPGHADIERKLRELGAQVPAPPPLLLRSLAMGLIATSILGAIGFLILPNTRLPEIINSPATLVNKIMGHLAPATSLYRAEPDSGPIPICIFFWIVTFAAIHFRWARSRTPLA